jgi:hypothetical protein
MHTVIWVRETSNDVLCVTRYTLNVQTPTGAVGSWVRSLPLADVLLDALPRPPVDDSRHPLRAISELSPSDLSVTVKGCAEGFERMLGESVEALRQAFRAYDANVAEASKGRVCAARKFEHPPEMKCGNIEDFHKTLDGRIGVAPAPSPARFARLDPSRLRITLAGTGSSPLARIIRFAPRDSCASRRERKCTFAVELVVVLAARPVPIQRRDA